MFALPVFLCGLVYLLLRLAASWCRRQERETGAFLLRALSFLALAAVLFLWLIYERAFLVALYLDNKPLFLAPLLAVGVFAARRGRVLRGFAYRFLIAYTLISPLVFFGWFMSFYASPRHGCERLAADPRVRPLFSNCDEQGSAELAARLSEHSAETLKLATMDPRSVFLAGDPAYAYLVNGQENPDASQRDKQAMLLVRRATGELVWGRLGPTVFQGKCLPAEGCYLTFPDTGEVGRFDEETRQVLERVRAPALVKPRWLTLPPDGKTVWVSGDGDINLLGFGPAGLKLETVIDLAALSPEAEGLFEGMGGFAFMAQNPRSGALYLVTETYAFNFVPIFRLNTERQVDLQYRLPFHLAIWGLGYLMSVEIDPELGELYASDILDGAVYVFDEATGAYKERIGLRVGVRHLACDRRGHRLFVSNYVDGYLYVVDLESRRVLDRIFLGRKQRDLLYDPETDHLLATSGNGWFEVDVSGIRRPGSGRATH